jgi:hypothetical protein
MVCLGGIEFALLVTGSERALQQEPLAYTKLTPRRDIERSDWVINVTPVAPAI